MNALKILVLATAIAFAACGDDGTTAGDTTTTSSGDDTTTTTGDTTTTTVSGIDPMEGADTDPKTGSSLGFGQLTDVAIGRHEGFDRVVFTFRDHVPGWTVQYVDPPIIEDASGNELEIDGDAFLAIRMEPASGFDMDAGVESYTGPDELRGTDAGASVIQEVHRTGDFEAVLNWVIGLSDQVDFRVDTLTSPARLVIDVRNH